MAELFVGPIIEKIIEICFEYLKDQLKGRASMKEALERLKKRLPIIRSVVSAYYRAQIRGQDPDLDRWIWQLRDAIDGADDLLDEFDYLKHKKQLKETKNFLSKSAREIVKVGKRALKIDPNLKRLEEVVQNLDEISAECLPSSLSTISSLNFLSLYEIPLLKSLPDLPSTLNYLSIKYCHPEFMERYEKISGSDWHKIAHIPYFDISE